MSVPVSIGPYQVVRAIGEGASAEVFLAQQRQPVPRRVALKLLRPGHDTKEVLVRFEREQQAMAAMNHAHIARVLDAGATEEGRPYFAMEYVPGLPITLYCDRRTLDVGARLALFLQLCEAVQHAHHKGVIHRDLKPSNVLVTEDHGQPITKVIDFGIAKALAGRAALGTLVTRLGAPVGTPEYMSPEQAAADALDVDTRTDVYALGVILYELLCGSLPFAPERLRTAGYDGMLEILRQEEPAPPSRRIATRGEPAERAARARAATPASLVRALRGDLDWIVLKAIAKDRNRRYATPRDLAADVDRALRHETVEARPPGLGYRLRKCARRHRALVTGATCALLALVGALVVSRVFLAQARTSAASQLAELAAAERAEVSAAKSFAIALQAVDELLTRVGDVQLAHVPQMDRVRKNLLLGALARYEDFLGKHAGDAGLRLRLAEAHALVGRIHRKVGDVEKSIVALTAAAEGFDALLVEQPGDRAARAGAAWARAGHALGLQDLGRAEPARALYDRALAELQAMADEDAGDRTAHVRLARALRDRATLAETRDVAAAKADLRRALTVLEKLLAAAPGAREVAVQAVRAGSLLARMETNTGAHPAAVALLQDAVARAEGLLVAAPDDIDVKVALADARGTEARCRMRTKETEASIASHGAAIALWRELADSFPAAADFRHRLSTSHMNRGVVLSHADRDDEARDDLARAIDLLEELVAAHPRVTAYRRHLAGCCNNLAGLEIIRNDLDAAEGRVNRTIELAAEVDRIEPAGEAALYLASGWRARGLIARRRQQVEATVAALTTAVDVILQPLARNPDVVDCRQVLMNATRDLTEVLLEHKQPVPALAAVQRALPVIEAAMRSPRTIPRDRDDLLDLRCLEAGAHRQLGDHAAASQAAEAVAALAQTPEDDYYLGVAFAACAEAADADPRLGEADRAAATRSHVARAVAALRRAHTRGYALPDLASEALLAPLRQDPDFQQLCRERK